MQKDPHHRVVIVGAGLSGLSAADHLLSHNPNIEVIVLEALDRVGGKTYTKEIMGTKFDLGAQFIGKSQRHVIDLANRAKQEFIPQAYHGKKVLYLNGQRSTYKSSIPQNVNILALIQMQFAMWKVNRMAKKVPLLDPKNCEMVSHWDSMTVQTWMEKNLWSEKVRLLFATAVRILLGSELSQVSFLYFLWFVHQNESFDNLVNIQNGLQQKKLRNGTQPLSFFLQDQIERRNGKILLNQRVKEIVQSQGKITVVTSENRIFECDNLILATAPSIFRKINFFPKFSSQKRYMVEKSFMGYITKVVVLYDKQYWKQKGYSGQIVSDSFDDPLMSGYDDSKYDEEGNLKQPALIVFVAAQVYRYWKERGDMAEMVCSKIADAFQCEELRKPLAIQWYEFDEQPTLGGGPLGVMAPGGLSHIQNLRRPEGNIHFAGTEMATVSAGYMDGAIQSGIRAANQIIQKGNNLKINVQSSMGKIPTKDQPWYNKLVRTTKKYFEWW